MYTHPTDGAVRRLGAFPVKGRRKIRQLNRDDRGRPGPRFYGHLESTIPHHAEGHVNLNFEDARMNRERSMAGYRARRGRSEHVSMTSSKAFLTSLWAGIIVVGLCGDAAAELLPPAALRLVDGDH